MANNFVNDKYFCKVTDMYCNATKLFCKFTILANTFCKVTNVFLKRDKTMILESFAQVTSRDNELLILSTYPGLKIESKSVPNKDATIHSYISLRPTTISIVPTPDGKYSTISNQTAVAYCTIKKEVNKNFLLLTIGNQNSSMLFNCKEIPKTSITARLQLENGTLLPQLKFSYLGKYFHPVLTLLCQRQKIIDVNDNKFKFYNFDLMDSLQFTTTIGVPSLMFGMQYSKSFRNKGEYSYSAFFRKETKTSTYELGLVKDQLAFTVLQYSRAINNWKFGLSYSISSQLQSLLTFSSLADLGKSKVRTSVTKNSVSSIFTRKINNDMDIEVSGVLNHRTKSYNLGIGFLFNNPYDID